MLVDFLKDVQEYLKYGPIAFSVLDIEMNSHYSKNIKIISHTDNRLHKHYITIT